MTSATALPTPDRGWSATPESPTRSRERTARRVRVAHLMGMPVSVHLRGDEPALARADRSVSALFDHLRDVDTTLSPYRPESDLRRVQRGALRLDEAHPWLAEVADLCEQAEAATAGLFSARSRDAEGRRVWDPTGLVKGWAVDGGAGHLRHTSGLAWVINAGGDILGGTSDDVEGALSPWRVGIEDPRDRARVARVLHLARGGVATSGTAARGAHIRDPRSGLAIDAAGSTTVVGPDLLWADIWATAAFVDPVEADVLLRRHHPQLSLIAL